jgi:hypothetical protein
MHDYGVVIISPLQPCGNFALEIERLTGERVRVF